MVEVIRKYGGEVSIIERAVGVAMANLDTHVRSLEQKHTDAKSWASELLKEQESTIKGWEATLPTLAEISVKRGFLRFTSSQAKKAKSKRQSADEDSSSSSPHASLKDFVNFEDVERAASMSREVSAHFGSKVAELGHVVGDVMARSQHLSKQVFEKTTGPSTEATEESLRLLEDLEIVAKKVSSDYEHVLNLANSSKSVSQASKMALLHTRNYLPSLTESSAELDALQRRSVEQRNASAAAAVQQLQAVSSIESMLASVNPQLAGLDIGPEGLAAFGLLGSASRLPVIYGSLLVESVRRREWNEKIKKDSFSLAEELAVYNAEEERRRKRWQRSIGDFIHTDSPDGKALGVEVNLQGDEQAWPQVKRAEIDDYLKTLKAYDGLADAIREISQLTAELDRPTRQQSKRARAFKNGSIHDLAIGRSSLLLRGDDDSVRSLKDEKSKLEDRLKGSESRVRKLEDLLHRQSHMSRAPSANVFQPASNHGSEQQPTTSPGGQPSSPRPQDSLSRRSSVSSRRFSSNQNGEERALVQRMVSLEAEIIAERERAAGFQKEAVARKEALREMEKRNEEAISTKQDLMGNLESQQRDFVDERRLLESEIDKLKLKLEELEDELDRVLGSRDNERAGTDQRVQELEDQLRLAREDGAAALGSLRMDADALLADLTEQRKRTATLDRQAEVLSGEKAALEGKIKNLEARMEEKDATLSSEWKLLDGILGQLSPDSPMPTKKDLSKAVGDAVAVYTSKYQDQAIALETVRTEMETLQAKVDKAETEALAAAEELRNEKLTCRSMRADLEKERARHSPQTAESQDGRDDAVGTMEDQVQSLREKLQQEQLASNSVASRLEARTLRAKDLTQRLYSQNDRLSRLLESLGFVVTRRNDSMTVQRVSRTASANVNDAEANPLGRSMSGSIPTRRALEESGDLDLLYWMQAENSEAESEKYSAYLSAVGRFDVEAFSEAVIKRVKETEHMARKWQKDSRAYREKSHRLQVEAHEKIAFRSFKDGDLALFLPTRNQATRPWAAFNVGAPHYFLREQDLHKLRTRDWLLARISKVEERIVDLSRSINGLRPPTADGRSIGESSDGGASVEDENPFELSDGLRWYLLDAAEEKPGAPSTPGLGKSTVASANVDVKGSIRMKKPSNGSGLSKTLSKSLDSRRSSTNSKRSSAAAAGPPASNTASPEGSRATTAEAVQTPAGPVQESQDDQSKNTSEAGLGSARRAVADNLEVRRDLLWGP